MSNYNPANWYWYVAGDESKAWSSAAAAYVPASDATFQAWLVSNIPTRILSEAELEEVLTQQYPAGWPKAAVKVELASLDPQLPRALENFWEVSGFDTTKLNAAQKAILDRKVALRSQLNN